MATGLTATGEDCEKDVRSMTYRQRVLEKMLMIDFLYQRIVHFWFAAIPSHEL